MTEREKLLEVMARAMLADELAVRPMLTFNPAWEQESDIWLSNAKAALTALEAAGVRLVPVEATEKMTDAYWSGGGDGLSSSEAWGVMLSASPYAPAKE